MRILLGILALLYTSIAQAVVLKNPNPNIIPEVWGGNVNLGIGNAIAYFIGVAAVLGVIAITWWGIQMVLAAGDEEKVKKARWIIQYALIGTMIAAGAYGIITFVADLNLSA